MHIKSPEQMYQFGIQLAQQYAILLLHWDLGAGKTTLIKGFAQGLGIDPTQVQSPTYAYLNIYDDKLLHIDMYRLESFEELMAKGILNQISDFEYIVIERPKRIDQLDLETYAELRIDKISASEREIHYLH